MFRAVISLIIVILLLIFASQNMDTVNVTVVTGKPVTIPLIMIIAISFVTGYAVATLSFIVMTTKKRRLRNQQMNSLPQRYQR